MSNTRDWEYDRRERPHAPDVVDGEEDISPPAAPVGYRNQIAITDKSKLAIDTAEAEAAAAEREMLRARERAERLREEARKTLDEADAIVQADIDRAKQTAAHLANVKQAAIEQARDALRPEPKPFTIEITDVWSYTKWEKVVEFVAHGAPTRLGQEGRPVVLKAHVGVSSGAPLPMLPRERSSDGFFEDNTLVNKGLDPEKVRKACETALRIHLDMVDKERIERGEAESIIGQKMEVET